MWALEPQRAQTGSGWAEEEESARDTYKERPEQDGKEATAGAVLEGKTESVSRRVGFRPSKPF